jgi:hypothetical protein
MMSKPIEYWFVLLGMVLYIATRDAEREPIVKRTGKTLASAALAVGLSGDAARWFSVSENIATVGIMAFGMILLDVGTALVSDRAFIKELIQNRMGGTTDGKS